MHMKKTLLAALLVAAPFSTMAAPASNGWLDVYYNDSDFEITVPGLGSGDDSGDGFGIRGGAKFSDAAFVYGEYQKNEYDAGFEVQFLRAGLGYIFSNSDNVEFYGKAEIDNVDLDDGSGSSSDETGFGIHGGLAFKPTPAIRLFGEIGYLDIGDAGDGLEYTIGAAFSFTDNLGLIADYRVSNLEDDDSVEVELSDLQLGVRFTF
ncbi:porin family protein [Solimonas sp. K1W22B-7]|uniref:outer membrane beta-barrel protein n=1 Tax=Solimonas sp. K1W22B-7 TaxID=2303331 RepID=UPI000E335D1C|nr:outer membrane beta-barrel protein [Solimonas sp. K1W22B-7]AXQ27386.1 porin family protein [Solimonas sp. K1W22B-7]